MNEKYLVCKNLYIEKNGRVILQNFNMSVNSYTSICILGESGLGKTLLFERIKNLDDGISLMGSMDYYFGDVCEGDFKELLYYKEQPKQVQEFLNEFFDGSKDEYKLSLLVKAFKRPDFLLIDDLKGILNEKEKDLLFKFLKQIEVTVIYATRDIEDTLFFSYVIVLKNKSIAIEGKRDLVLKEEKLLKLIGYSIPFYVNMSYQLRLYGVLDKISYNKEDLEVNLWH